MAIDVKSLFAETIMELSRKKTLGKISISDLIRATGASRQTFYHHFEDKEALLVWIYDKYILNDNFNHPDAGEAPYSLNLQRFYRQVYRYRSFLKQAIDPDYLPNLRNHIMDYSRLLVSNTFSDYYRKKHKEDPPDTFYFFLEHNIVGFVHILFNWINRNCDIPSTDIAKYNVMMLESALKYWDLTDSAENFYLPE